MSRSSLHRKIKVAAKISANKYIRQFRLEKGMEMLKQTSATVSEVAWKTGFCNPAYFIKCFHDYYGYAPGKVGNRQENENRDPVKAYRKRLTVILSSVLFLVLAALVILIVVKPFSRTQQKIVIAIPPFEDRSAEGEETLIPGIRDVLHTKLGVIENLIIVGKESSDLIRGKNLSLTEIGKKLKADYLLTGSGGTSKGKTQITIELVDSKSGFQVWSNPYEVELGEHIFDLQRDVANKIVEGVKAKITPEEKKKINQNPTTSSLAMKYYTLGIGLKEIYEVTMDWSMEIKYEAINYFKLAVIEDSTFAEAYEQLAHSYIAHLASGTFDVGLVDVYLDSGRYFAEKALYYDDQLILATSLYANYLNQIGKIKESLVFRKKQLKLSRELNQPETEKLLDEFWNSRNVDYCNAIKAYFKYIELKPENEPFADFPRGYNALIHFMILLAQSGYPEQALKYANIIYKENGNLYYLDRITMQIHYFNGDYETALKLATELNSQDSTGLAWLNRILGLCAYVNDYERAYQILMEHSENESTLFMNLPMGVVYLKSGDEQKGRDYINRDLKMYEERVNSNLTLDKKSNAWLMLAFGYNALGETEMVLHYLKYFKTLEIINSEMLNNLKLDIFDNYREEPEFQEIYTYCENKYLELHECVGQVLKENGEME
jgi:TolB-like protein/AraC-like DNA-binding protein